ncbi:MAG: DNA mismatch repair protein MutS [Gemmataceae bacterium]
MTRMMQQYHDAKAAHPGMLVLFRNGEFYELFEDDAVLVNRILGLTLTKRDGTIPMAGVPVVKVEHYLNLLLKAGHRVAVCEQMEEPDPKKKIIRREVNRIVTPGTITDDGLLDPRAPNHLVAIVPGKGNTFGVSWVDLSTGSFSAADVLAPRLPDELARLNAAECIFAESAAAAVMHVTGVHMPKSRSARPDWTFDPATTTGALRGHFKVGTVTGFGFEDSQPCIVAAGAVIIYLQETLKASLAHIRRLKPHRPEASLALDEVTRRSLELTRTLRDNQREGSLLSVLDRTVTPMGARLLHDSLLAPLTDTLAIDARLDAVEEILKDHKLRGQLRELLEACADIQRLTTRVSTARANPKDLAAIARTLRKLPAVKAKLAGRRSPLLQDLEKRLELCPDIRELLDKALTDDPPYIAKDGGTIKNGYNAELDELRTLMTEGKNWIARYQAQEITRTGIASLKVQYNQVAGYYIEVSNANASKVPADYTEGHAKERRALHHHGAQGIRGEDSQRRREEQGPGTTTVPGDPRSGRGTNATVSERGRGTRPRPTCWQRLRNSPPIATTFAPCCRPIPFSTSRTVGIRCWIRSCRQARSFRTTPHSAPKRACSGSSPGRTWRARAHSFGRSRSSH